MSPTPFLMVDHWTFSNSMPLSALLVSRLGEASKKAHVPLPSAAAWPYSLPIIKNKLTLAFSQAVWDELGCAPCSPQKATAGENRPFAPSGCVSFISCLSRWTSSGYGSGTDR